MNKDKTNIEEIIKEYFREYPAEQVGISAGALAERVEDQVQTECEKAVRAKLDKEYYKAKLLEWIQINHKGQFELEGTGEVCWYLDDLIEVIQQYDDDNYCMCGGIKLTESDFCKECI